MTASPASSCPVHRSVRTAETKPQATTSSISRALLVAREEVAVGEQQPVSIVDVIVELGNEDHQLAVELAHQPRDVGRMALGSSE